MSVYRVKTSFFIRFLDNLLDGFEEIDNLVTLFF